MPQVKTVDSRGRLALGKMFAGKHVQLEKVAEGQYSLTFVTTIPEREAWLYKNPAALDAVRTGLQEAREGRFSENPPDLEADDSWLEEVDE